MPQNRVAMRKIREILRLAWSCNQTRQSISDSCVIGKTTVTDTLYGPQQTGHLLRPHYKFHGHS